MKSDKDHLILAKVVQIGDSLGIALPQGLAEKHGLKLRDSICFKETADGILLKSHVKEFEEDIVIAKEIMRKRKNLLKILA